mmetsp:Transcript_2784/g.4091  ORF Transcript_2784/g.4091 Transcript_2784/m.4091 type:complete len:254 (-) Transcript_2784:151-912(-)|eukprot:CAMPEP_0113938278 /NCGR_PEP_ID=MMETSP1339-20121228/4691_1 /TAXON_ID=94617 /ORGANISM="Fibrocapsa japonica" /LENGTH=253 /DNA_ID=CAMNT_0000941311 /DNA_START=122 /DNA_END=883 /DNA_ORIENTATION=- /assembly_acc=CAM_ASM_000762
MGKKKGVNTKVEAANERKAVLNSQRQAQKDAETERKVQAEWSQGANLKGASRAEERERKQMEALAKRAEKKKLLEDEESGLPKSQAKKTKVKKKDIPPWELALQDTQKKTRADKAREARKKEEERKKKAEEERQIELEQLSRRENKGSDNEYEESMMSAPSRDDDLMENMNRIQGTHEVASGIDSILKDMSVSGESKDRHPEKRMKAAYKSFEQKMMPEVREEFPGLKRSQYKEKIFDMWKKSPENPMNQKTG